MSKQTEAFRNLMERLSNNVTLKEWELCNNDMQIVENTLDNLTPPTEQEVCDALSEYYDTDVLYENKEFGTAFYTGLKKRDMNGKEYIKKRVIVVCYEGEIGFNASLPPHLITLIGRFYEGRMDDEH